MSEVMDPRVGSQSEADEKFDGSIEQMGTILSIEREEIERIDALLQSTKDQQELAEDVASLIDDFVEHVTADEELRERLGLPQDDVALRSAIIESVTSHYEKYNEKVGDLESEHAVLLEKEQRMKLIEQSPELREQRDESVGIIQKGLRLLQKAKDIATAGPRMAYKAATSKVGMALLGLAAVAGAGYGGYLLYQNWPTVVAAMKLAGSQVMELSGAATEAAAEGVEAAANAAEAATEAASEGMDILKGATETMPAPPTDYIPEVPETTKDALESILSR